MQQHTAQHLISAVLFRARRLRTTSWWLASHGECYIDVEYEPPVAASSDDAAAADASNVDVDSGGGGGVALLDASGLRAVEATVQSHVEAALGIDVHVYESPAAARGDAAFQPLMPTMIKPLPADDSEWVYVFVCISTLLSYQCVDPRLNIFVCICAAFTGDNLRFVAISGVDTNPCCGTHLSNTAQLATVHLVR